MVASSGWILLFSECLYRLLLSCYPAEFRRAFQQEMMQTFRDCCRDAFRRNGTFGVLRLWGSVLYDLAITASAEQVRALVARLKYLFGYDSHSVLLAKGMEGNTLVTQFHLNVAQQVRAGLLTQEQARTHEKSNLIYRCLGGDDVEVDTFSEQVQEGDVLVLCTDGLTRVVSDGELRSIVEQFGPEESASRLIERANEQGGPDNVTAIVVRVSL